MSPPFQHKDHIPVLLKNLHVSPLRLNALTYWACLFFTYGPLCFLIFAHVLFSLSLFFFFECGPFLKSFIAFVTSIMFYVLVFWLRSMWLPYQESNLHPLHWKVKSKLLDFQGSPFSPSPGPSLLRGHMSKIHLTLEASSKAISDKKLSLKPPRRSDFSHL